MMRLTSAVAARLEPVARHLAERFADYLSRMSYPIRAGTHANSAFAMILARDRDGDVTLTAAIDGRARDWFGADRDAQAWEPDGDAFLSPTLIEALLMHDVLGSGFGDWFAAFLPDAARREPP